MNSKLQSNQGININYDIKEEEGEKKKPEEVFKPSGKTHEEKLKIIKAVRARIIANDRALSGILSFIPHEVVKSDHPMFNQVAFADGKKMYFSDFFFSQDTPIMCAIVIHEMLHIVFGHKNRGRNKIHSLYNIACDAIINDSIGYKGTGNTSFRSQYMYLEKEYCVSLDSLFDSVDLPVQDRHPLNHWTSESLYKILLEKFKQDILSGNGDGGDDGDDGENAGSNDNKNKTGTDILEDKVKELSKRLAQKHKMFPGDDIQSTSDSDSNSNPTQEHIESAIWTERYNRAKSMGIGSSSILATIKPDVYKPQIPWEKQLRKYLVKSCMPELERTYRKPSRRMASLGGRIYLPGTIHKKGMDKIAVIIDTSGSCFNNEEQTMFATEIDSIQKTTGVEIQLIFADSQVQSEYTVKSDGVTFLDKLKKGMLNPQGGGGTDMTVPIMYAKKQYKPFLIVVASDGYTPFPTRSDIKGTNLIWIINTQVTVPKSAGRALYIHPAED
jgi:predicted metal-dependent peptidase